MAKKPTLTTLSSGFNSTTTLNNNFTALRNAFDNTLSLDGSTPNAMNADFDLNGNNILNANSIETEGLTINGVQVGSSELTPTTALFSTEHTGNGSTTTFSMTYNPGAEFNTYVFVDGVYQNKSTYSISGTNVIFSEAPPLNSKIEINVFRALTLSETTQASNVGYTATGASALRTVQAKLDEFVSVKDFGAVGDGVVDDTAAIQNAIDAAPFGGSVYFPSGKYIISSAITVNKPMTIFGPNAGSIFTSDGSYIRQVTTTENAFTLVARTQNYAFGAYGIVGVTFENLAIYGNSQATPSVNGIGVDTSVNGGDFHIRECVFRDVNVKWFAKAYDLKGIAYLNDWFNGSITQCTKGVVITRGAASDSGGQTRFFGLTAVLNAEACVELNLDTASGDFAFFGCTLSESGFGIKADEEALLGVYGCQFESNQSSGNGAGIYIAIAEPNPNTEGSKVISNCKFINNDADIWVDKTTTAFSGGGFHWPMTIDGCVLQSTNAIKVTVPAGHVGIDSPAFVIGPSNSGNNATRLGNSQISANFLGSDLREYPFNTLRNFSENFQQVSFNGSGGTNQFLASLNVPNGSTLYLKNLVRYSINTTTGARGNAQFQLIDGGGVTRLTLFGTGYVGSASWTNSTGGAVEVLILVNDGGSGNPYYVACRAYVA
jgi:hypothetical protein